MKKRNVALTLLTLLGIITSLDRINISVAGPVIMDDLKLTETQFGWVLSIFILSYSLFQIPLGAWGDKKGQRMVLAVNVLWWSMFTGFTGMAGGFMALVAIRFIFGIGEAGAYPNMTGVIGKWFPKAERGRAQGFIWAASRFGGAISGAMNNSRNLGGFVCATVSGYMVASTGNYKIPLYMVAGMLTIAALLFLRIDPTRQIIED
jgi:MFS family permease